MQTRNFTSKLGHGCATFTCATHVHLSLTNVTIRGVLYISFSLHLFRTKEGKWLPKCEHVHENPSDYHRLQEIQMDRQDYGNVSNSARLFAYDHLIRDFNQWADPNNPGALTHDAPGGFAEEPRRQAETEKINQDRQTKLNEIDDLTQQLHQAKLDLAELDSTIAKNIIPDQATFTS